MYLSNYLHSYLMYRQSQRETEMDTRLGKSRSMLVLLLPQTQLVVT